VKLPELLSRTWGVRCPLTYRFSRQLLAVKSPNPPLRVDEARRRLREVVLDRDERQR
jgi:hypothetical protein